MDDLISRHAAIKAIGFMESKNKSGGFSDEYDIISRTKAMIEINNLPPAQSWIPCSERLPEHDKIVLCCTYGGVLFIGYIRQINKGEYLAISYGSNGRTEYCIVAWMPLPRPYDGEVDG